MKYDWMEIVIAWPQVEMLYFLYAVSWTRLEWLVLAGLRQFVLAPAVLEF